ncbi:LysR substrate-binding domain-containing protein [Rhodoferax sediminis]|uniref:LysR family transcriptional regulator n=1 Tax=Rhodoferax sediminis TaxID=2509614 RepID=A0A515DDS7_9BURK|nr:LysR substrate-binding domain-containing protein [Rhodoferax sediminis]QDL38566.1 LysR family transcriptional regulator [Rhodoferax sediminis]
MKLRQLQCLCAVVDAGFNISRAASVLHATQPAVSKQLRQFEEELGVDLLLRQRGRPVALTEEGQRTLLWARRALQAADNIRGIAREGRGGGEGSIALATSHAHANHLLLPAIVAFSRRFPKVRITVLQGTPGQIAELVRDGKATLGVTHAPEQLPRETVPVPFLTSPRVLVTPPGHPLLKTKALTLEKIAQSALIVQHSARPRGSRIVRKFVEAGLEVNVVVQALDSDVIKTYVGAGLGVGIIPAFTWSASRDRAVRARDVGHLFEPSESVVLLRRQSHLQKYVYRFLEELHPSLEQRRLEQLVFEDGS